MCRLMERKAAPPQIPSIMPAAPPRTASRRPSVSSRRIRCPRPAPKAARMASSRSRTVARTSRTLPTFTQASSNTSTASPRNKPESSVILPLRGSLRRALVSENTNAVTFLSLSGYCRESRWETTFSAAWARSTVTPLCRRATTDRLRSPRFSIKPGRWLMAAMPRGK